MIPLLASSLTFVAYIAATALLVIRIRRLARGLNAPVWPVLASTGVALALHTWILASTVFGPGGIHLGLFNAASLIAWQIVLLLLLASMRRRVENLGIMVLPLAAMVVLIGPFVAGTQPVPEHSDWHVDAHILISVLAFSLLALAMAQAILLSVQERSLRHHQPGGFIRALPPLQSMEEVLFQLLWTGFVLLSLALATGLLFVHNLVAQHLVDKTVLSFAAWLVFGILLFGRWRFGWRGRIAIRWTMGGGVALILAYFGSKFVLEMLLGKSWG
ncbi:MAG TPA: cytochrome c biogenesis protein CcsA [Gammaproteobacteria bacterium]|nr:cytochrome c biogenesis protein CcsA [Gammaproteobacteria bacterium]